MHKNIKLEVQKISSGSSVYFQLDSPKKDDFLNGYALKIRGWAYAPSDKIVSIAIERGNSVFITERSVDRPDVKEFLKNKNQTIVKESIHGFDFEFIRAESIRIGFCIDGHISWVYKIIENKQIAFKESSSLEELLTMSEGVYNNYYFHNSKDWSKFLIFFNGALTPDKIKKEGTVFQRWSWAKNFKHPVLCIADPLTVGEKRILLAWYLGRESNNILPSILDKIIALVKKYNPDAHFVGLGSSGGGFAAIAGTLLGRLDEAIAINPQTDAMLFEVKSAVSDFMAARNNMPCDSDLKQYEFGRLKENAKVVYLQNLHDKHHKDVHYEPFRKKIVQTSYAKNFKFIEYEDLAAGHAPPSMEKMEELIGSYFSKLLI